MLIWRVTDGWLPASGANWRTAGWRHFLFFLTVAFAHLLLTTLVAFAIAREQQTLAAALFMQIRGRMHLQVLTYTTIVGTGAAFSFYRRDRDRKIRESRLEAELASARLDALRAHVQPHFLFNSLHSIASLARAGDSAAVVRLIAGLSDLLRRLLDAREQHLPLHEELTLVERYLEIQQVRFADRLDVSIDLAPDAAEARVPLLVVQPLVENALRHGLAPMVERGELKVRARRADGWTRIEVEDSGVGLPEGWTLDGADGTGLRNLRSRLAMEFGSHFELALDRRKAGGVVARVSVPYQPS